MSLSRLVLERPVIVATTALASLLAAGTLYKYFRTNRIVCVKKLVIYPVKSLRGIEVDELEITSTGSMYGIFHDRMFLLISETGTLISQRTKPKLSLIRVSLSGHEILLEAPGMKPLKLDARPQDNIDPAKVIDFQVWGGDTQGIEYSPEASQWFSDFLGANARLIQYHSGLLQRPISVEVDNTIVSDPDSTIVYQDGAPFLLVNNDSVADLNRRLARSDRITYVNFRPNILIENAPPYWEDSLKQFRIGSVNFKNVKLCTRCTLPTVIPDKGVKHAKLEPLRTLKEYRIFHDLKHLYDDEPLFGINLTTSGGRIRINDPLVELGQSIH